MKTGRPPKITPPTREAIEEHYVRSDIPIDESVVRLGLPNRGLMYHYLRKYGISSKGAYTLHSRVMSEVERAWLAAAIDGEGSIGFHSCKQKRKNPVGSQVVHYARITVTTTSAKFIEHIKDITGVGNLATLNPPAIKKRGHKTQFAWRVTKMQHVYEILSQINPYLIIKKEQANNAMAYCLHRMQQGYHRLTEDDHRTYGEFARRGSELNRLSGRDKTALISDPLKL